MKLHHLKNRSPYGYTSFGSVWNRGEIVIQDHDTELQKHFVLENKAGERIPMQSRVSAWWSDGSIKWAAHIADAGLMGEEAVLRITEYEEVRAQLPKRVQVSKRDNCFLIDNGKFAAIIPLEESSCLLTDAVINSKVVVKQVYPVFVLEQNRDNEQNEDNHWNNVKKREYRGKIQSVQLENQGDISCTFCFHGVHIDDSDENIPAMPFVIRMTIYADCAELRIEHTFLYDGQECRDHLAGMGIRLEMIPGGNACNHHIKFVTDENVFHETAVMLASSRPRLDRDILKKQMDDVRIGYSEGSDEELAAANLPVWSNYSICQDSVSHYVIQKQTEKNCCKLDCLHGLRTSGTTVVAGENASIILGIRDFWQKYPREITVKGLGTETVSSTLWYYSPDAPSFDFRHYANRTYPETSYEGFSWIGASAYGIGVTDECMISLGESIPSEEELQVFDTCVQRPPVYVGTPEYYHSKKAFGEWSLVTKETEVETWLEEQLEKAVNFYLNEIEQRNWYGLFNYGDFMHTYDAVRHTWKYDIGGFAWQNTELVPTYWLWLYFLRTGREDVFTVAEAMSRHSSEVDMYHMGPYRGIGSRHNVRHWGCSCKEPRISMAGHHRFLYYLNGDARLRDVFSEVRDAGNSMEHVPYFKTISKEDNKYSYGIRLGPDWSALVSDWMTWYEQTREESYRQKIEVGIQDIMRAPFHLYSGPFFEFVPETGNLKYTGEYDHAPNTHLQICMGGPQVLIETAEMLQCEELKQMLIEFGSFYFLSNKEKSRETRGKIVNRPFSTPFFAAGLAAYAAMQKKDVGLAKQTWNILLEAILKQNELNGFEETTYALKKCSTDVQEKKEIPWISTNFVSQWCLNVIMCLNFIRETLPADMEKLSSMSLEIERKKAY